MTADSFQSIRGLNLCRPVIINEVIINFVMTFTELIITSLIIAGQMNTKLSSRTGIYLLHPQRKVRLVYTSKQVC